MAKADRVAVCQPAACRPFPERARRRASADESGARAVFICLFWLAFEDQDQRRAAEQIAFQRFDRPLQPARVLERAAS